MDKQQARTRDPGVVTLLGLGAGLLLLPGCPPGGDGQTDSGTTGTTSVQDSDIGTATGIDTGECVDETWYPDDDSDGFGADALAVASCDAPGDSYILEGGDCDDGDATVNPTATEVCDDGVDNDCDGAAHGCGLAGVLGVEELATSSWQPDGNHWNMGDPVAGCDHDGDGSDDLFIAAPFWSAEGSESPHYGTVRVSYGSGAVGLDQDFNALPGWRGETQGDLFGGMVRCGGDLDGDGFADLLVGASLSGRGVTSGGSVTLIPGGPDRVTDVIDSAELPMAYVAAEESLRLGTSIGYAGDADGDGAVDLLVGGSRNENPDHVFLFYGTAQVGERDVSSDDADLRIEDNGEGRLAQEIPALGAVGDLDGDGLADSALPFSAWDGSRGAVLILRGASDRHSGVMASSDLDRPVEGAQAGDEFGRSVVGLGDQDGDGLDDFAVSAWRAGDGDGAVYVVSGGESTASRTVTDVAGLTLVGTDMEGAGATLGTADLNGDAQLELTVHSTNAGTGSNEGALYVIHGPFTSGGAEELGADATIYGRDQFGAFGARTASLDHDGDGDQDLAVAAIHANPGGGYHEGVVWLIPATSW